MIEMQGENIETVFRSKCDGSRHKRCPAEGWRSSDCVWWLCSDVDSHQSADYRPKWLQELYRRVGLQDPFNKNGAREGVNFKIIPDMICESIYFLNCFVHSILSSASCSDTWQILKFLPVKKKKKGWDGFHNDPTRSKGKGVEGLALFYNAAGLCSRNGKAFALQKASCRARQFKSDAS